MTTLQETRAAAYAAFEDHQRDLKNSKSYRKEVRKEALKSTSHKDFLHKLSDQWDRELDHLSVDDPQYDVIYDELNKIYLDYCKKHGLREDLDIRELAYELEF